MQMPGRKYSATTATTYRFGFNGKEDDKDINIGIQDYGMRIYSERLGRFLSVDPLGNKYPELTSYQFASNTPIQAVDLDGGERLDMTNINEQTRTATITIVHTLEIVKHLLANELSALNNNTYKSGFINTTVYTKKLPENGQPIEYITQQEYNTGVGYALSINYDTKLLYINNVSEATIDAAHSLLATEANGNGFSDILTFAHATVDGTNTVGINPMFDGFAANGGVLFNESYEELIRHEVGSHNFAGQLHQADANGLAIYPAGITLESRVHNNIKSSDDDTKLILKTNITTRSNLTGQKPKAAATPVNSTPVYVPLDDSSPDFMKINQYAEN
jgi:RHS repeat-associated protein